MIRYFSPSLLISIFVLAIFAGDVFAQSSLGIGRNEQALPTGGLFDGFFRWVRDQQAVFQEELRAILIAMRNDGAHLWSLITLCFLYGVFHAIGPGHGKVVISSYMVANEVAVRRGVFLSLAASFLQGLTAIVVISFFLIALRGSGIKTGDLTYGLEIASYVGVMGVGLWLIWRKLFKRKTDHIHSHSHSDDEHGNHGDVCDDCGHSHAPDPKMLEGVFGLREAWLAILAVGLRPCTGALIVLVFCFANGLYLAGIASTLAMSLGTGIAVSTLAILAVTAKNVALRIAGVQGQVGILNAVIEISAAFLIFLIGFVLFSAAITS